tara:strand:- start:1301 stop:1501 length:201 start_codon:yes stop_codon:yes gene_type:complete
MKYEVKVEIINHDEVAVLRRVGEKGIIDKLDIGGFVHQGTFPRKKTIRHLMERNGLTTEDCTLPSE